MSIINVCRVKSSSTIKQRTAEKLIKSGTILFPSSFASIKDGMRTYFTTVNYEIIPSLEETKFIMLSWFSLPGTYELCDYLVCFNFVFQFLSNTYLFLPLLSHQNTITGHGEALRQSVSERL